MARRPKYSTETLIFFLEEYVKQNGMRIIKAVDVAKFCREQLGYTDVSYQMFTRNNPNTKLWIETFNEKLKLRRLNEDEKSVLKDGLIDIDFFVQQYSIPEKLKNELIKINRQIATLSDETQNTIELYRTVAEEKEKAEKELSLVKAELATEHKLNKQLQSENKKLKKYRSNAERYIKNNIYDPIILSHFQEIGLILNERKIQTPQINEKMIDDSDDLKDIIDEMYGDNSNGEDTKGDKTDIISEKTDNWIRRFDEL